MYLYLILNNVNSILVIISSKLLTHEAILWQVHCQICYDLTNELLFCVYVKRNIIDVGLLYRYAIKATNFIVGCAHTVV